MRDHYHGFSHPVLVDLPETPPGTLFEEMSEIADELRSNPEHIELDDQVAFRQLQKLRLRRLDLTVEQFHDLFAEWQDAYRARQEAAPN